ncbi:hypothetical protein bcere0023_42030 [Bacillus cereus Rock4-2]|nr:hypothetical protein bcere0023_42030 [Bacillus cereus Rock4-2]
MQPETVCMLSLFEALKYYKVGRRFMHPCMKKDEMIKI